MKTKKRVTVSTSNLWTDMDPKVRKLRIKKMQDKFAEWISGISPEEKMLRKELVKMESTDYWK